MKLLGMVAGLTALASGAHADSEIAPPSSAAGPAPLASGLAWSADAAAGLSISSFSVAPALGESASLGSYLHSSERSALALEAVEAFNVVIDRTTPQYGLVGVGLRRLSQPENPLIGAPGRTLSFQRVALGPCFLADGNRLELGISAALGLGYLTTGRSGVSVDITGYVFDTSSIGANTLLLVNVGYVISPRVDAPRRPPPMWQPVSPARPPSDDEAELLDGPCRPSAEYESALQVHRKRYVEACAKDEPACDAEHATIDALNAKLKACTAPKDDDANP